MPEPCEQEDNIKSLTDGQKELNANHNSLHAQQRATDQKVDDVLRNQSDLLSQLKEQFGEFRNILMSDVERRKDIDEMRRDTDRLAGKLRAANESINLLNVHRNACDTLQIWATVKDLKLESDKRQGWVKYRAEAIGLLAMALGVIHILYKLLGSN